LIAHAIIVVRNWSVASRIRRHFVPSDRLIQAVELRDSLQEIQHCLSGHQGQPRYQIVSGVVLSTIVKQLEAGCAQWIMLYQN
jgi:hypothetical protein